jgi:hypothetical protein
VHRSRKMALMTTVVMASAVSLVVLASSGAAPTKASPAHAVQGALGATADMAADRAAHTATTLPDGRVLVAGGFVEKGSPVGAELYDAAAGRFSALPPMVETRHSHSATILPDGTVLIVGGYGAGTTTLQTAEIFDPRTRTFTRTGSLVSARADHIAVLLGNGTVLVAGGLGPEWTFLSSAEVYDPATRSFSPTGGMTVARESHTAVTLEDGRVLIAGGHRGRRADMVLHASAEVYHVATGTFAAVGDMGVRRHKHDAVRLRDGRVLVTGGADERDGDGVYDTTELFDPTTGTFTAGPSMVLPRYKHGGASLLLANGTVLIAGGAAQAETYDPVRQRFTLVPGEPRMAGLFAAVAPLGSGGALITGGYGQGRGPRATAWVYRP